MHWREGNGGLHFLKNVLVNEAVLPKFWTAVNDPMSDGLRRRHSGIDKKSADANDRFLLADNRRRFGKQQISSGAHGVEPGLSIADRLSLTGKQHFRF